MLLHPPRSTRTDTLCPSPPLFRSVQLDEAGNAPAFKTSVKVQEARQGSKSERISLAECLERWVPFLNDGGVLIDQAYQPQSSEGMVRCYVCGHRVVG